MKSRVSQPLLPDLGITCADKVPLIFNEEFGSGQDRLCNGNCFLRNIQPDYVTRLEKVGGLQLPDFQQRVVVPELPPIILGSVLDSPQSRFLLEHEEFICVKYDKVAPIRQGDIEAASMWRSIKNVPAETGLLIGSEMNDKRLAIHFRASLNRNFYIACSRLSRAVFSSLAFSIYNDGTQCRWWQPYNLARSYRSAFALNSLGLPCVVAIGADHQRDEERIAEHAARQGERLTHFAVNCQTNGRYASLPNFEFARRIELLSGRIFHWVFFGVADERNMHAAYETLNRHRNITFVTSKPVLRGIHGGGIDTQKGLPFPIDTCVEINVSLLKEKQLRASHRFREAAAV